jgi:hypothetical protein
MAKHPHVRRGFALFPRAAEYMVCRKRTAAYSHPVAVVDLSPAVVAHMEDRIATTIFNRAWGDKPLCRELAHMALIAIVGRVPKPRKPVSP